MGASKFIICEHCDAVYERAALTRRQRALCIRCGAVLYRGPSLQLQTLLALTATGLILFALANLYPLVSLQMGNAQRQSTLWGAVEAAWATGVGPIAVLSALTVVIFPLTQLLLLGYVLTALLIQGREPPGFIDVMHVLRLMRPWSMVEVFLIGSLVAVVKIAGVAAVQAQVGLFALGALTFLLALINSFDLRLLWDVREKLPR